jgi:hypothetical protein
MGGMMFGFMIVRDAAHLFGCTTAGSSMSNARVIGAFCRALRQFILGAGFALLALQAGGAMAAASPGNQTSPLGVNLRELRYWSTEFPTVDFFKRAGSGSNSVWLTQCQGCGWNTNEQASLDLDASGWPRSLPTSAPATYRYVTTILVMAVEKFPAGRWTVFYEGEGTLSYGFDAARNAAASVPGRDIFDVAVARGGITLSILATDPNHTGNYLRNIRVIPPGGTCDGDPFTYAADSSACPSSFEAFVDTYASRPFHPLFLSDMRPFSSFRIVHLGAAITDQTSDWAKRTHLSDASWGYSGDLGVPIEFMLDMANALNAAPWLNIPARADDNFVTEYARMAKARLKGSLPIYLEYYNEAWNGSFPYNINGNWIEQQAIARWPGGSASNFTKRINWFGLRTKQICAIWKQEFADQAGRVKCVMGAQAGNPWTADQALSCPLHAAEPGGSACDSVAGIDSVAGGYYFGGHISDAAFQAQIEANWFTSADGGLAKLFQEINDGSALTAPAGWNRARGTVAGIANQMAANAPIAAAHHVAMVTYEGGNELVPSQSNAYQTRLQDLFVRANRDPRIAAAYMAVLDQWKAVGGTEYMVFESTGAYSSTRGNSPLLEWQGQPRSDAPKYDAVLSFIENNPCWWPGCGLIVPPGAPAIISAVGGQSSAAVAFSAPVSNGGSAITGYTVSCSAASQTVRRATGIASPLTVQALSAGVAYSCSVSASNMAGTGASSAALVVTPLAGVSTIRNALFINASSSGNKTSVLRLINLDNQSGALSATAYNEAGVVVGSPGAYLGTLMARQMVTFTSAQLEAAIGYSPAAPTAKYRIVFSAGVSNFELINFVRDIATGNLTLAQAQVDKSHTGAESSSTRDALFVNASTSGNKTSVLRLLNLSDAGETLTATAYNEAGSVVGSANASLGTLAAQQMLTFTSAQLESAIGYFPASPTAKYRIVFSASGSSLEVLNFVKDIASGNLTLGQAQTYAIGTGSARSSTRNALVVYPSSGTRLSSVVRLINTGSQSGLITATAYNEAGATVGVVNAALGTLGARQGQAFTSAQLEAAIGYPPSTTGARYRIEFNVETPGVELINFIRDNASGSLVLAQAQIDDRTAGSAASSNRHAGFVNASTSTNKSSVVRLINLGSQGGQLSASAFDETGNAVGTADAQFGTLAAGQTMTLSSAQLEQVIGYAPASSSAKYWVVFNAVLPSFEVVNYISDVATGNVTLGQAQID